MSTFTRTVAHDLNNIFTIMSGFAELAMMDLDNKTELLFQLKKIKSSVSEASKLIEKLLNYPK